MNGRALSQVGLGLLGLWVFVQALIASFRVLSTLQALASTPHTAIGVATILPVVLLFAVSYVLVTHNAGVARWMFPDLADATPIAASGQARILVGLLGIFLFCTAIPPLFQVIPSLRASDQFSSAATALQRRALAGYGVQMLLAIVLMLWPGLALRLWDHPARGHTA